jgi:predicted small lipoprotein YifL
LQFAGRRFLRTSKHIIFAVIAASALAACGQKTPEKIEVASPNTTPSVTAQEKPMDRISRPPPPDVAPVEIDGIIYTQVLNARKLGMPVAWGYLKAEDSKTGARQWVQKVYDVKINPADETDVQEVYFRRLERVPGQRSLRIENEAGGKFTVNIDTHKVTAEP